MTVTHRFRVRTVTAGVELRSADDLEAVAAAVRFLEQAAERLTEAGYEVQTLRVATQPLAAYLPAWSSDAALETLAALDHVVTESGALLSLGPVGSGRPGELEALPAWTAELLATTAASNLSLDVAPEDPRRRGAACRAAAATMLATARATAGGEGNFRFAAAAGIPAGTPFFPVAWHLGAPGFALGLELPPLLRDAIEGSAGPAEASSRIASALDRALGPLQKLCRKIGRACRRHYAGIDVSLAPGLDASVGELVETLSGRPFGEPATLAACALLTGAVAGADVERCGYCGLMLPVLEDPVLAARAVEGRFGINELLLYSSVCGTGLDVVPLPGETAPESLAALIGDVASLALRLGKPLAARLLPVPGKRAGQAVEFDNPYLTGSAVLPLPGGSSDS